MQIESKPVQNFTHGRQGFLPEVIVLHIMEGTLDGTYRWFSNPTSSASSTYGIGVDGLAWAFVSDHDEAWANGIVNNSDMSNPFVAGWINRKENPNLRTISIEHEGHTGEPWTDQMYTASTFAAATSIKNFPNMLNTWNNAPQDRRHMIIGHYQIDSINRLHCPGTGVDFSRYINMVDAIINPPAPVHPVDTRDVEITDLKNQLSTALSHVTALQGVINTDDQKLQSQDNVIIELKKENTNLKSTVTSTTTNLETNLSQKPSLGHLLGQIINILFRKK